MDILYNILIIKTDINKIEYDQYIRADIYNLYYNINNNVLLSINYTLLNWNGIKLKNSYNPYNKKYKTFKEYFFRSRTWFDNKKKNILIQQLWIPLFNIIIFKLIKKNNKELNELNKLNELNEYKKLILFEIFSKIFESKIQHPCTKLVDLISFASLRDNGIIHNYLINYIDNSLNIKSLLLYNNNKINKLNKNGKKDIKQFKNGFINHLQNLLNQQRKKYQLSIRQQ